MAGFQFLFSVGYLCALLTSPAVKIPIVAARWEPFPLNRPYLSTSITSFWSEGWHSTLRRTFMLFVYKPVRRLSSLLRLPDKVGRSLAILATFTFSGFHHEFCLVSLINPYYDPDVHAKYGHIYIGDASKEVQSQYGFGAKSYITTFAFAIHGFIVLFEDLWCNVLEAKVARYLLGRSESSKPASRVVTGPLRSVLGWLWTAVWMMYTGYLLTDVSVNIGAVKEKV
jgi:hypothetical protein